MAARATIRELLADIQGEDPQGWARASAEAPILARSARAVDSVCRVLASGTHEVQRHQAADILGAAYGNRPAGRALLAALLNRSESPLVRGRAAEQLAFSGSVPRARLVRAYLDGLDDAAPVVRFWCIYGLAIINAVSARSKLQQLAASDEAAGLGRRKVCTEAKWALAVLDDLPERDRLEPGPPGTASPVTPPTHAAFLRRAIALAAQNVRNGRGGPFGALIVRKREVIAEGVNLVAEHHDPTAHAEIIAIREACRVLETFDLSGCDIYCSCEPNPMCLGAIYWARLTRIFFAASREDAARAGFNDLSLYRETSLPLAARAIPTRNLARRAGLAPFRDWERSAGKIRY